MDDDVYWNLSFGPARGVVYGTGTPALLLVHGWGATMDSWRPHIPLLAQRHRVITVDIRGHGRSDVPTDGYDPDSIAGDLLELLDLLHADPVVAVGHSWGAQLVAALATHWPDRVAALVMLDPAYGATSRTGLLRQLELWRSPDADAELLAFAESAFSHETPVAVREAVREGFRQTPRHVIVEAFFGMYLRPGAFGIRPASEAYLSRLGMPTLSVFSSEEAAAWATGVPAAPGSAVVAWPGTGHYLHQERPDELVTLVEQWLDGLSTG
jgi:pimeloyl-ACP methyl ester carboxylesterase